jgi:hypothetical protein
MLKERDIESNHDIAKMQMAMKSQETDQFNSILKD